MATPQFSVPALDAILDAGHQVVAVYCQPPRPAGRGKRPRPGAVQRRAQALGLTVCTPISLRTKPAQVEFAGFQADVAVVVAYGLILPQSVLDAPRHGCLNIHASLLPRWRGAAPIHRAIMAGDRQTGVCIMQMDAGLDTGPVLMCQSEPIRAQDTMADVHDRLATLGAGMIAQVLGDLNALTAMPQPTDGASYAAKIDKSEARIDWAQPAAQVDRLIRGLSPFPGAWCDVAGARLKLLRCQPVDAGGAPGQVLGDFVVACGEGAVKILQAQRPGKRPMPVDELLRGLKLPQVLT